MQNVDIEMFGDFDLDRDRFSTIKINDFETNTDVSTKSRFGVILDLEIEKLISSQENHCQYKEKHLLTGTWCFQKLAPREKQECVT